MLRIASIPDNISILEDYLQNIFNEYHLDQKLYPNVLISLTEAVNNAIIHGNQMDENKFVQLNSFCKNHKICFRISDEGSGFDPKQVPDPTQPENIEKCGGRGVFLMYKLSDRIDYSDNGRTVELEFCF
ncbi:MAG: ATP-binding protein [Saprospiraceae bacterium]|jgi:serine/threonine-protein kinase RsbW|nr:ATP-binding protein [Saprospiraceae bacterium]MBK7465930.1 ATP-binding protein [Saprospiraceae bacterium]MBK9992613.1 ATP-binding protein [Saprospiraceae bacterium]